MRPTRSGGLAAEIGRVAFEETIEIDQPWDRHGMANAIRAFVGGRSPSTPMRGISAHSNGFQTARALHMLQVLIGAVDCPGAVSRFEPPYPKPLAAHPRPHGRAEHFGSNQPLSGPHLGFPLGPEDLLIDEGRPAGPARQGPYPGRRRLPRPWADAHGNRPNCPCRRSVSDRRAVPLHGQHGLELVHEHGRDHCHAGARGRGHGANTASRKIIVADAYASETVAYADLVLPDTTLIWSATTASRCSTADIGAGFGE